MKKSTSFSFLFIFACIFPFVFYFANKSNKEPLKTERKCLYEINQEVYLLYPLPPLTHEKPVRIINIYSNDVENTACIYRVVQGDITTGKGVVQYIDFGAINQDK